MTVSKDALTQALDNMRAARDNLGEGTIQAIADNIQKLEARNAKIEKARQSLETEMDAERAMIEILGLLKDQN